MEVVGEMGKREERRNTFLLPRLVLPDTYEERKTTLVCSTILVSPAASGYDPAGMHARIVANDSPSHAREQGEENLVADIMCRGAKKTSPDINGLHAAGDEAK